MNIKKLTAGICCAALALGCLTGCSSESGAASVDGAAAAADYPSKEIQCIVPQNAGGGTDALARAVCTPLEEIIGKPIVIVNNGSASGLVGTENIANADPDGYTLGVFSNTDVADFVYGDKGAEFDVDSFTYIAGLNSTGDILLLKKDSEIETLDDFIAYAKENPGKMTIGLFAIAEMIKQGMGLGGAEDRGQIRELKNVRFTEVWRNIWKNFKGVLLKSSVIGTFIGILPGTGGAIASFLAYGEAKGKDKDGTFGTGNPAGIIAPESANNAAVGGSLVPMLSLGIPGSSTSAIMFGALTIHGLVPGQRLFVEHGDVAYTFMVGMFFTAIFMMVIGCFGIPLFAKVLKLNLRQIIPVVLLCSLVGAYSVNNSMYDVIVAIACGILGVVFAKLEMPTTPVVLGLILGSLIESNFVRTQTIVTSQGANFFVYVLTRPLCIGILCLTAYLICSNVRAMRRGRQIQQGTNIKQDLRDDA